MNDLITILDDLRSFDNGINELSLKINEIPLTQTIEEKENDVLHSMDELDQLLKEIRSLFNEIYNKSNAEKDEETASKLKGILLRMKNGNI